MSLNLLTLLQAINIIREMNALSGTLSQLICTHKSPGTLVSVPPTPHSYTVSDKSLLLLGYSDNNECG